MSLRRRKFTREFKLQVLHEIDAGKSIAEASREFELHPTLITRWRKLSHQYGEHVFSGNGNLYRESARIAELERMVGKLTMENALLKKALERLHTQTQRQNDKGGK